MGMMHQTSAVSAVIFYSNEIFTEGEKGNNAEVRARIGTLLVGIATFIAGGVSIPILKYFKRTTIMTVNTIVMMVCHASSAICALFDADVGIIFLRLFYHSALVPEQDQQCGFMPRQF
jgi:hypothetical protein